MGLVTPTYALKMLRIRSKTLSIDPPNGGFLERTEIILLRRILCRKCFLAQNPCDRIGSPLRKPSPRRKSRVSKGGEDKGCKRGRRKEVARIYARATHFRISRAGLSNASKLHWFSFQMQIARVIGDQDGFVFNNYLDVPKSLFSQKSRPQKVELPRLTPFRLSLDISAISFVIPASFPCLALKCS